MPPDLAQYELDILDHVLATVQRRLDLYEAFAEHQEQIYVGKIPPELRVPWRLLEANEETNVMTYRSEDLKMTMVVRVPRGENGYDTGTRTFIPDGWQNEISSEEAIKLITQRLEKKHAKVDRR